MQAIFFEKEWYFYIFEISQQFYCLVKCNIKPNKNFKNKKQEKLPMIDKITLNCFS